MASISLCSRPQFNYCDLEHRLLETVLESFLDSDNFDYLLQKTCTKERSRDIITLEGLREKITTEVNRGS